MIELPDDSDGPDGLRLKALRARLHAATVADDGAAEELQALLASLRCRRLRLRQAATGH
jgi:hypothetical protein